MLEDINYIGVTLIPSFTGFFRIWKDTVEQYISDYDEGFVCKNSKLDRICTASYTTPLWIDGLLYFAPEGSNWKVRLERFNPIAKTIELLGEQI